MPKGVPKPEYTGEFKQMVVETMRKENCAGKLLTNLPSYKKDLRKMRKRFVRIS